MITKGPTYSLTLWPCRGCSNGLFMTGEGDAPSEFEGTYMFRRGFEGLNGPGDDAGVVLAVRKGI